MSEQRKNRPFGRLIQNRFFMSFGAIFCCALWGISTPVVKMGYDYVDEKSIPALLLWIGVEFVLGGALTLSVYGVANQKFPFPKRRNLAEIGLISLLQTVLQYVCLYIGLAGTTSMKGAIIKSTDVFFIMLIASLLFRQETLTVKKIIACVIGFSGIVVMNLNGLTLDLNLKGDGVVLLGIVFYSFSVVFTRKVAKDLDATVLCGSQMFLGGAVMTVIGLVFGGKFDFPGILPVLIILSLIYAVSYSLWTLLLKHHPASRVAIFSFMTPLFGVAFSAVLLPEKGGVAIVNLLIALVLVCGGIVLWGTVKDSGSESEQQQKPEQEE